MKTVHLLKTAGGVLCPANESDAEALSGIRNGSLLSAEIKQPRNPLFHRKLFALLNFTYDYFEPEVPTTKSGVVPEKNFERFREDITVLAGFYDVVISIKGEARYQAKSISFGSMDEVEFHNLYRAVFGVCWRVVLSKVPNMTENAAENTINQMLAFN